MTLFLCKVQNIYIFDIQKLTIIIYTIVRGFTMEKNKIIQDKKHIIFIDRLTDHHIKDNGGEVLSMVRFAVGEGIEKKQEDFAAEVAAQINAA